MLAEVTASATAAEKVKSEVQKVKDKAQKIVDEINYEKSIAEEKLEAAKPALMEAERALQVRLNFNSIAHRVLDCNIVQGTKIPLESTNEI